MRPYIAAFLSVLAFTGVFPATASAKMAAKARVTAAEGPVQISLRLHATRVHVGKSLWYKLELKNIGKRRLRLFDRAFLDPWTMHKNCRERRGVYLEILLPDGKPLWVRSGGGQVAWDYAPKPGQTKVVLTPKEKKELRDLEADAIKLGWTAQQKSIALGEWNDRHHRQKQREEMSNSNKQLWLSPGASTSTLAWAYRTPKIDGIADHPDEEPQIGDFTQLWSYAFPFPGTYRVRAVYDHAMPEAYKKRFPDEARKAPRYGAVKAATPYIQFEVLP